MKESQDNSNIPVVPKYYWEFQLFCAGEKYKFDRAEITQEQAKAIFSILKSNKRWVFPVQKSPEAHTGNLKRTNSRAFKKKA